MSTIRFFIVIAVLSGCEALRIVHVEQNSPACETFKPGRTCESWCLQPPWQPHGGSKATHLDCCKGEQPEFVTHEICEAQTLFVGYLFTGEAAKLRLHFQRWANLSSSTLKQVEFLLVVDADTKLRQELWQAKSPWDIILEEATNVKDQDQVPVVHMVSVDIFKQWNIGGKRNLLFHEAAAMKPNGWVLMLDADLVFDEFFLERAIDISKANGHGTSHQFNRKRPSGEYKPHPAAILMQIQDYWRNGGCDEDFVGHYGSTDPHFRYRMQKSGLQEVLNKEMCLTELPDTEEEQQLQESLHLDRSTTRNSKLFDDKKAKNEWSNIYLRFDWGRIRCTLKPSLKSGGCAPIA